jgi:Sigma-70, region 4
MPDEVDPDDLDELTALAAALAGERSGAARLVGETLAAADRLRRVPDSSGRRGLLGDRYLRQRAPFPVPPGDDLPGELGEVAARLTSLSPFDRAALVLSSRQGLPLTEVAGLLDTSSATVRRRLAEVESRLAADPLTVRATLETLSWRTPDPADVATARIRAKRTARRRRGRLGALALALGIALLATLVVPLVRMQQPLPVRAAGDWALGLELDPPPGWRVGLHAVTADQEFLQLTGESGNCRIVASLSPTRSEALSASASEGERAWVQGRPVRYNDSYGGGGVRWPYGKHGDVTLLCTDQDRKAVLTIAQRVRFSAGRRLDLPFALNRLPTGFRVAGAGYQGGTPIIALTRQRSDAFVLVTIAGPDPDGRPVTFDGVDYRLAVEQSSLRLCRPVQTVSVCVEGRNNVAVPKEIVRYLRLAPDLTDRSTWFDARDALPQ